LIGLRLGLVIALAPAGKHLDRRHDLGLPVARTAVIVPLASLQTTLDGDLLTLAKVLAADLRQAVPGATLWFRNRQGLPTIGPLALEGGRGQTWTGMR
jgi:hypothetical protein